MGLPVSPRATGGKLSVMILEGNESAVLLKENLVLFADEISPG